MKCSNLRREEGRSGAARWSRMMLVLGMLAALLAAATACSDKKTAEETDDPDTPGSLNVSDAVLDPAELIIYSIVPSITMEHFERTIKGPIQQKYPHYGLEYMLSTDVNLENLIVSGTVPDIFITSISGMSNLVRYGIEYDLRPLIEKYNYDLSRIEPAIMTTMQNAAGEGRIFGLPRDLGGNVLFYNKHLFDQFGVQYPSSGMTWDETYELARLMTRTFDGVAYRGFGAFYGNLIVNNQMGLPLIDPVRETAAVNAPGFHKFFDMLKRMYEIDGNKPVNALTDNNELTLFHREKTLAMVAAPMSGFGRFVSEPELDWDIVAAPTFSDAPGIGYQANPGFYYVANTKNSEQAFQAVTVLLGDEVQMRNSKEGIATVLVNEEIRNALGQEHPVFPGKNFAALFYNQFAPTPAPPKADIAANVNAGSLLSVEFRSMIENGGVDVNTMLRVAEEKINQAIAAAKAK